MKMKRLFSICALALVASLAAHSQTREIVTDENALFGGDGSGIEGIASDDASSGDASPGDATANKAASTDPATGGPSAISEDDLFGDANSGIETVAPSTKGNAVSAFLKSSAVRIGGSYTGSVAPSWTWTNPWNGSFDPRDPDSETITPSVGAKVFFDARPDEETRFYGSVKTEWPFKTSETFLTGATYSAGNSTYGIPASVVTTKDTLSLPNIRVFELFADRSWDDRLFFRFGKHTVKWGVGYFWSPADVINLTSIDVNDPTAQREGPISLRLNAPILGTQSNIWAYALLPNAESASDLAPKDVAYAAKYEFLLGNYEIGTGAFWQRDRAPKGMLTATGSIGKFTLFGEAVLSWGSDKEWVDNIAGLAAAKSPTDVTSKDKDGAYFSGTGGFSYMNSGKHITGYAQYFYNGDGYSTSRRKELIADGRKLVDAMKDTSYATSMSGAFKGLIYQSGQHYAGVYLTKGEFLNEDLTIGMLSIANLSDLSGFVQPTVSYQFFTGFSGSFNPTFYWSTDALWGAGSDGEYVIMADGPSMTLSFKATLGSGNF